MILDAFDWLGSLIAYAARQCCGDRTHFALFLASVVLFAMAVHWTSRARSSKQRARRVGLVTGAAAILSWTLAFGSTYLVLAEPLGNGGSFAPLGGATVTIPTDANYTASATDYRNRSLNIVSGVSLTAPRQVIVPLQQGITYELFNATTGGQAITFGGSSGATVTVAPNTLVVANCPDGANFYSVSGGGGAGLPIASIDGGAAAPGVAWTDGGPGGAIWTGNPAIQSVVIQAGYGPIFGGRTTDSMSGNTTSGGSIENHAIIILSGTQTDSWYAGPCVNGADYLFGNSTTGRVEIMCSNGSGGTSGTGSWIPSGALARCHSDGTNYACQVSPKSSSRLSDMLPTSNSASVVWSFVNDQIAVAVGSDHEIDMTVFGFRINDNSTWNGVFQYAPAAGESDDCTMRVEIDDRSGLSDGGVAIDASAGDAGIQTLISARFMVEFDVRQPSMQNDGGAGSALWVINPGTNPTTPWTTQSLTEFAVNDTHGCTTAYTSTGCTNNGTTTYSTQAYPSDGGIYVQVKGTGTQGWPQQGDAITRCRRGTWP